MEVEYEKKGIARERLDCDNLVNHLGMINEDRCFDVTAWTASRHLPGFREPS